MMFVEYRSGSTLDYGAHPTVDHYVTTIRGRLYTYDDGDEKVTIGRIRAWKLHLDLMEADGQDPWEVMDAESGDLEALYSAVFDVQTGIGSRPRCGRPISRKRRRTSWRSTR